MGPVIWPGLRLPPQPFFFFSCYNTTLSKELFMVDYTVSPAPSPTYHNKERRGTQNSDGFNLDVDLLSFKEDFYLNRILTKEQIEPMICHGTGKS
jgi:hypothetical protein